MSGRLLESVCRWVMRAPGRAALLGVAVMTGAGLSATRIEMADDARALIAGADAQISRQLQALSDFTAVDQLLIQVDAGNHPEQLLPAAAMLAERLQSSDAFDEAVYAADLDKAQALGEVLMPQRFLLDPRDPDDVMAPVALDATLEELLEKMLAASALGRRDLIGRDPIGSVGAALAGIAEAPGLVGLDASDGIFRSRDGTSILVLATPAGDPFGGADAARSMAELDSIATAVGEVAPDVALRPIGAHRFARDAERMVRRDVHASAALTLALVLVIFVAFFRRPRLILVAVPPLAFGAAIALGVAGALGAPIHGIVLAFSAACLGLSIDYTIHLLAAAAMPGADIRQQLPSAARRIGGSLALAGGSTVIGLAALSLAHVPALRQMALLASGAVVGAFVGNLLWVPILLPLLGTPKRAPLISRGPWSAAVTAARSRPWTVSLVALIAGTLLALEAAGTTFEGDLRILDTHTARAQEDEADFAATFGDPTRAGLALVETATLDEALTSAEAVAAALRDVGFVRVVSPAVIAPASSTLESRHATWCANQERFVEAIERAAARRGFRPGAFAGFAADLEATCLADPTVLADRRAALEAFGVVIGRHVVRASEGSTRIAVPFEGDLSLLPEARARLHGVAGATLVHRSELTARLTTLIAADVPRLAGAALLGVLLLLLAALRRVGQTLRAVTPVLLGGVTTLGLLAAWDVPLNLMNLCVLPLLAGLGIDYGVLIVHAENDPDPQALAHRAFSVTVAATTTLAGFGSLALAEYAAISTIGRSVLLAVTASALFALWLPPALAALRQR